LANVLGTLVIEKKTFFSILQITFHRWYVVACTQTRGLHFGPLWWSQPQIHGSMQLSIKPQHAWSSHAGCPHYWLHKPQGEVASLTVQRVHPQAAVSLGDTAPRSGPVALGLWHRLPPNGFRPPHCDIQDDHISLSNLTIFGLCH